MANSGKFLVDGDANSLEPHVDVGGDGTGTNSVGYMTLQNMNGYLSLVGSSYIQVEAQGQLKLGQTSNSDTKGGINTPGIGSSPEIIDFGSIERVAATDTPVLKVGVPIWVAEQGTLTMDENATMNVDNPGSMMMGYSVDVTGGSITLASGSVLSVSQNVTLAGGSLYTTVDTSLGGAQQATIGGNLIVNQGTDSAIWLGFNSTSIFPILAILGDFTMDGGELVMSVQGGAGGTTHDSVTVTGAFRLNASGGDDATLSVTTVGGAPTSGTNYDLIIAASVGTVDFSGFSWYGGTTYSTHGYVGGTTYRITAP